MFSLTILASGSSGNCALLTTPRGKFLVDAGLSARQIRLRLDLTGTSVDELQGIFITHEHIDHVAGLPVLLKGRDLPVWCNRQTADFLRGEGMADFRHWQIFSTGSAFSTGDLDVQTFAIPHDAVDPVGYAFHCQGRTIGFLTDLGHATKLAVERVRDAHTLVIETNHDEKMLQNCPKRPWSVKQRIMSRHGHLSNQAAAAVLEDLLGRNLRQLVLGHLSRDCNTPALALATIHARLTALGVDDVGVHCASSAEVSPRFSVPLPAAGGHMEEEPQPVGSEQRPKGQAHDADDLFREWFQADTW